nr:transmembrane protein 79 isoform X1 [Pogona vitticeps]
MAAVAPSEEMGMVVLRNDSFGNRAAPNYTQHSFENPKMTLPWDQGKESVMIETLEADPRPSPEGSRGEATVGPAVDDDDDDEAFARFPSTVTAKEEDNDSSNGTPKVASHVFIPIDPRCIERPPTQNEHKKKQREREEEIMHCEKEKGDLEKQNFISRGYSSRFDDSPGYNGEPPKKRHAEKLPCLQNGNCSSGKLKAVASMTTAMVIFPCLLYGAYVFLPFDAPLMPTMSSRLVYTLRCGVFATFPIIVGMVVYGVSRLCFSSLQAFDELHREVEIHRHYVSQSVQLFILYFFNIAVLSTYLPQEALKLIPLLTALFAISRLFYWLAYAMGRSFRGFGFGLTFLPLLTMLLFNLYSMFLVDSESMFATGDNNGGSPTEKEQHLAGSKPRYWG